FTDPWPLDTTMCTAVEVVVLPCASVATAVMVRGPSRTCALFQLAVRGEVAPLPTDTPSTSTSMREIGLPPSVAAAVIDTTPLTVAPSLGAVMAMPGPFRTVTDSGSDTATFPAPSRTLAVSEWRPLPTVELSHEKRAGEAVAGGAMAVPST